MLDEDLAKLYGVTTKRLNEQVKRNKHRFPKDFMFQLTYQEVTSLRSQFATLEKGRGKHRKYLPYAFTEHGTIMLATILNSQIAIKASLHVVRAFVKMRELFNQQTTLAHKLSQLEGRVSHHDKNIQAIIEAIRGLMEPPKSKKRQIGFAK